VEALKNSNKKQRFITMSAGNFGRSFAFASQLVNFDALVVMPQTVPKDRIEIISNFGAKVELQPRDQLQIRVDAILKEDTNARYAHPFDDVSLFQGYGSVGLEILEDLEDVDVIVVGVGGGGFISGVSAAVKLSKGGENVRVVGVEPEGANSMFLSLEKGEAVVIGKTNTFVNGLSPPLYVLFLFFVI